MKRPSQQAGFSLVISLIILTLLAILVVSFISTSTLERTTARAFANKAAAEIAAQTATNQAISLLTERITQYPDSATVWEPLTPQASVGGYGFEGTVLYGVKHATDAEDPNNPSATRWMLPLVSRGVDSNGQLLSEVPVAEHAKALGSPENYNSSSPDASKDKWTDDNSLDLNRPRSNTDTTGWIGSTPADGRKPYRARWIEVQGTPPSTQPAAPATPAPGKTISRYAFWVEDESFKVNLNMLDNNLSNAGVSTGRGSEATESARLDKTQPLPPQLAGLVPIQGLLRSARAPYPSGKLDTWAGNVRGVRNGWFGKQLFELRAFNHADLPYPDPLNPTDPTKDKHYGIGDGAKFLATIYSGGLNLSRHGTQRVNLNGLGFEKAQVPTKVTSGATTVDAPIATDAEIYKQIEQVVQTIKYHAPKFGQRFYRNSAAVDPTTLNAEIVLETTDDRHQSIYLHKVAANIRDYIDPDSQPTLILAPPSVPAPTLTTPPSIAPRAPAVDAMYAGDNKNKYWAQGKDGAPYIQEAVARFRTACTKVPKAYSLTVDYYIEIWNMTGQDIYAKALNDPSRRDLNNAFVQVSDTFGWFEHKTTDTGGSHIGIPLKATNNSPVAGDPDEGRNMTIDLVNGVYFGGSAANGGTLAPDGVVFKAGACTVITTDPDGLPTGTGSSPDAVSSGAVNPANTYYCPNITGKRVFTGPLSTTNIDGMWAVFRDIVDGNGKGTSDYGTAVIMGNSYGYFDSAPYSIPMNNGSTGPHVTYSTGSPNTLDETYGGALTGNVSTTSTSKTPSQTGDPRTNNEQLVLTRYLSGGVAAEPDVTRYPNSSTANDRFSLGWPNARYTVPFANNSTTFPWKDYYKVWSQSSGPFAGVLSPTADTAPAFVANGKLTSIGQLGDVFDPARILGMVGSLGIGGSRGGGRTFKIGQQDDLVDMTTATAASQQWAAWRLTDFFDISSDLYQPGLININGLRRDNGAALRAACYGLTLSAVSQASSVTTPTVTPAVTLNSQEAAANGVQNLITQAILRLQNDPAPTTALPSYFRERGELSDLSIFSAASLDLLKKDTTVSGTADVKMGDAFDRTREELFRRLAGLITTRGNVFSVYAVGQSITEGKDAKKTRYVTGEHWVKTTFALLPKKADGTDFQVKAETFIPDDATSRAARFAKPDHYDIQLLQVTSP